MVKLVGALILDAGSRPIMSTVAGEMKLHEESGSTLAAMSWMQLPIVT